MMLICPKCHYVRKATDEAPEWQCPSCQVAYAKAHDNLQAAGSRPASAAVRASPSGSKVLWLVGAVVLGVGAWMARPSHPGPRAPVASSAAAGQPNVVLYGTSWCGYCAASRRFFAANGIQYTDVDLEKSAQGRADYEKLGGHGAVPLIAIGDEVMQGYSEEHMRQLLGSWLR